MISLYIKSVIIWAVILYATATMFSDALEKQGWIVISKENMVELIYASAIPVFRLILWIAIIFLAFVRNPENK